MADESLVLHRPTSKSRILLKNPQRMLISRLSAFPETDARSSRQLMGRSPNSEANSLRSLVLIARLSSSIPFGYRHNQTRHRDDRTHYL